MDIKVDHVLDAKGLACPMPIVKTRNEIKNLNPGDVLEVQATDKGSEADIKAWSKSSGHDYLGTIHENGELKHYLRKAKEEEEREPMAFERIVSLIEVKNKLDDKTVTVVDVREPAEYAFSHVKGAVSIPLGEIETRMSELNKDNDIFVICQTGNRSDFAAQALAANGFTKVANVIPGMVEWDGPINKVNGGN